MSVFIDLWSHANQIEHSLMCSFLSPQYFYDSIHTIKQTGNLHSTLVQKTNKNCIYTCGFCTLKQLCHNCDTLVEQLYALINHSSIFNLVVYFDGSSVFHFKLHTHNHQTQRTLQSVHVLKIMN